MLFWWGHGTYDPRAHGRRHRHRPSSGSHRIRLTGTLARILNVKDGRYGCVNACVGGGQGVATIIEREEYEWC